MTITKDFIKRMELDDEETKILEEQDRDEWVSSANIKNIKAEAKEIAKNTKIAMRKNKSITIRINDFVLNKIKAKALSLGIPYQTLITQKMNELVNY